MKIGIDARFVGPQGTGLGKYTEKLVENLAQIDNLNHYVLFLKKANWNYLNLHQNKNFHKVLAEIPWYGPAEQIKLPRIFQSQNLDLLHVPHFNVPVMYPGKFIVTIHDLIHHQFKETSATTKNTLIFKIKRLAYKAVITNAVLRSQKIITPSNYVKGQVIKNFKVNPDKIAVTYEAAEDEYFKKISNFVFPKGNVIFRISNLQKKFHIKKPFLVYVGNAYPHKNLEKLLQAVAILVNSSQSTVHSSSKTVNREPSTVNLHLIIACARDVFYNRLQQKIKELNLEKHVTLTGYIEAKDLVTIFQQAEAYVFPTLSEGFGIPALNAMAAGLPVAASNIPILKEVYGDAALYFDPHNPNDIAEKIRTILTDSKTRSDLIKKGSAQAKKYSWPKMARQTLEIYNQAHS